MANRYDFSNKSKKKELPLTKRVESGQIWQNKTNGVKFMIDRPDQEAGVWVIYTVRYGNKIESKVHQTTLVIDYNRIN